MKYMENIKVQVGVIIALEFFALVLLYALGMTQIMIALIISVGVNATLVLWILYTIQNEKEERAIDISRILGKEAKGALDFGEVGIITYNDQNEVTWASSFIMDRNFNIIGRKVTTFLEGIDRLFRGDLETMVGKDGAYTYEITRNKQAHVLFVRDISKLEDISKKYQQEAIVIGLIHMDNYADIQAFENETMITSVNTNLRQPIVEWADTNGIAIRRLRSDRFMLILNEEIFNKLLLNKFDIVNYIRTKANEIEVNITVSMAFARGHTSIASLDDMVSDLLELAQSRGGDQVVVKKYGDEVKFYGGKQEATSTRSRVRVRVMAQAIKELVMESNQVFITGHKEMDFDCMGANIALSRLVQSYGKKAYIVSESGGKERALKEAMNYYEAHLENRHHFISDDEAQRLHRSNDLTLVVDYHNPAHSNAPKLLDASEKILVIDHHRRSSEFVKKPVLVYLESSASSSCELISELIAYQPNRVDISEVEATIMYVGILVDTNRFKMRTGFRTFEASAQLRKWGASGSDAESMLKEDFEEFEAKINVLKYSKKIHDIMMISCMDDQEIITRSQMSKGADEMLSIRGIEASFVIARISENQVAISARSKGGVNVQRIMESMRGGGHFSAAAVQRENMTTYELEDELNEKIERYLDEEELSDESNTN